MHLVLNQEKVIVISANAIYTSLSVSFSAVLGLDERRTCTSAHYLVPAV